jgi:hypothetical protein
VLPLASDPRYERLLRAVITIFDAQGSAAGAIEGEMEAAEALG